MVPSERSEFGEAHYSFTLAPPTLYGPRTGARAARPSDRVDVSFPTAHPAGDEVATSTPVNTDRIRELLTSRNVRFGDYNDSELVYLSPNAAFFWNATNPQILQLRAQWRGIASTKAQFTALVEEVGRCNATRSGPKAYLAPLEDGIRYGLGAECNIIVMSGLTPAQLDTFFETAMSMIMSFFTDVEAALPDFVDWNEEER